MSDKSLPENDLPDIQTKNPNPPDEQSFDPGLPIGSPPEHEQADPPADSSNDTNNPKSPGRPARHGLRRRRLFIAPEDADRYERFHRHMMRELCAADHTEFFIAEAIIAKRWLILHCDEAEAAAMRNAFAASELHTAALMDSNAKEAPRDDDERFDHAMAATCTDEKVHLVLRYRTFHERALVRFETMLRQYRTIREARELAELRAMDANPPSEISNLKSESPTAHHKPNMADALANITSRNPSPGNPSSTTDLRANQTNCRNSSEADELPSSASQDTGLRTQDAPDDGKTLALRAKILEDIQEYYAHLKRPKTVPGENAGSQNENEKHSTIRVEELYPTPDPYNDVTEMAQNRSPKSQ